MALDIKTYEDEFMPCRYDRRHRLDYKYELDAEDRPLWVPKGALLETGTCVTCGAVGKRWLFPNGDRTHRRFTYPEGYLLSNGEQVKPVQFRKEQFRRQVLKLRPSDGRRK